MSNKFVTILDDVGRGLKWFFTNKTAEEIEQTALSVTEVAFPALSGLLTGIGKSLATAQGLASAANTTGQSTVQVTALAIADAQEVFQEYQTATGTTIETAQQKAIIQAFINLLQEIPAGTTVPVPTPATSTSAPASTVSPSAS